MRRVKTEILRQSDYREVWDYQTEVHKALIEQKRSLRRGEIQHKTEDHRLIFCEHNTVYTLGKSGSESNLLLDETGLAEAGIQYYKINRGGDITYHGPGQWTVYPILDLDEIFTDVHKYVRFLEECIIQVCAEYGLSADREPGYTGVWLGEIDNRRKICAIGVHLSRWVSLHGLAFNVNTDLSKFAGIIPCGIDVGGRSVTSLSQELGREIAMEQVQEKIEKHFLSLFHLEKAH